MPKRQKKRRLNLLDSQILIVNDYSVMVETLTVTLETAGYGVIDTANNGQQALEMQAENSYDLILMNVRMPRLDGWSALQKLRESGDEVAVIMHSAMNEDVSDFTAERPAYDDFIQLPFSQKLLLNRVSTVLQIHQARRRYKEFNPADNTIALISLGGQSDEAV